MSAISNKTDAEILRTLGERVRQYRLHRNITQQAMADKAGLSRRAIYALESGQDSMLSTLVRVLRALERLQGLELILPAPVASPLSLLNSKSNRPRMRARASRKRRG